MNFKAAKVATLVITDEIPEEVYRHLCIEGEPMSFRPTKPSASRSGHGRDADDEPGEVVLDPEDRIATVDEDEPPDAGGFAPYDPASVDARHRDSVLQVLATPEALDKSLRRLDEQARATLEEQGVNVLFLGLGMLHYTESADSRDVLRAPLVMIPVSLSRRSARTGYQVSGTDEEPMVNPALAEHLRRMGIALPELAEDSESLSALQSFFGACAELAAERARAGWAGWEVKADIVIGLFAFQKLVMFKDLERNEQAFGAHRLVRQLVTRELQATDSFLGLPAEIRGMSLDGEFAPEQTAQVVDADASQLRAIATVSRGHDLVIEGPPGTGKSQTITNLIAQALQDGKSVLFVAEKLAALQVVHSRLVKAGLGEFCLELHGSGANKRKVLQELRTALDASLQRPAVERRTHRLPTVRGELTAYATAVHEPYGALGFSPYRACGLLEPVLDAPLLPLRGSVSAMTPELLADTEQALTDLAAAAAQVGDLAQHPWRGTARTFYTPGALQELRGDLDAATAALDVVLALASEVEQGFALPPVRTAADIGIAMAVATVFERSPGAPLAVLESDAWNAPPTDAMELVEAVRTLQRWRQEIDHRFTEAVLDQAHGGDIDYVRGKTSGVLGFLAILDGRFRTIKKRWLSYRSESYSPSLAEQAEALAHVDRYVTAREELRKSEAQATALFGALWQADRSDPAHLERYIQWVVEVRGVCIRHGLGSDAMKVAAKPSPDVGIVRELKVAAAKASEALGAVATSVEWPVDAEQVLFSEALTRLREMRGGLALAPGWGAFERARQRVSTTPAAELVVLASDGAVGASYPEHATRPFAVLASAFRRAVLGKFLEEVTAARPPLRDFETLTHEQRLTEFRRLDEWVLQENRASLVSKLRAAAQERIQREDARAGLPFLQREMAKQRNHAPLRRTLQQAEATIRAIKPCFLMSPLTVAQYLDGRTPSFDLVIFDEASQLPAEDAIGTIARGRQLVVVGDPKQLPPTSFFGPAGGAGGDVALGEDGLPIIEDSESVLEEFMGAGIPVTRLRWHYRSAHESLITFSNVSFYDADLYTFPSVETGSDRLGLSFTHVGDGVYEGKGLNMAEARRLVDAVVRHAKEHPDETLGVGTFNLRQQLAILDELEVRRRQDPSLEPFFSRGVGEPFFVKNLENIQGDERDTIFLSVTYAKGTDGRLRHNFGPINGENGWRRLNVLTTRARRRMRVFSSIRADDINPAATSSRGAQLLRDFLRFAEHGQLDSVVANVTAAAESPFEAEVASELIRRGVRIVPQVGASGYRIDIGVLDDAIEGRFVCAIECDGVAYHSSETARDRDRLRQQVLEARGWIVHRVWSTDWFKDRSGQVERLLSLIAQSREEIRRRRAAPVVVPAAATASSPPEHVRPDPPPAADERAYVRPAVPQYVLAPVANRYAAGDILTVPVSRIREIVVAVVAVEAPVHRDDVASRVASAWGNARVGSRIAARAAEGIAAAVLSGAVEQRGEFLYSVRAESDGESSVPVRSRVGTRIPGDRVAPEEISEAVRLVLSGSSGMQRDELLKEVRLVLGVGRSALADVFGDLIEEGLRAGLYGEASAGIALLR